MDAAALPERALVASAPETPVRPPRADEQPQLVAWLDAGLRDGRRGRLAREYPTLLGPGSATFHQVAWVGGRPGAHAAGRVVRVRCDETELPLGMIGLVYTDPRERRRGLATACVEACTRDLARAGAAAVILWSDRHAFYRRLGFVPAGRESLLRLDARALAAAIERLGPVDDVGEPEDDEWPLLETMIRGQRSFALRVPGELQRLAAAPDCSLRVARREGRAAAYAARGRGDDFPGVVHEWAGCPAGVAACLSSLLPASGELQLLCGPAPPEPVATLRAAGAPAFAGVLGLVRLVDPAGLWRAAWPEATIDAGGDAERPWLERSGHRVSLDAETLLHLILGPAMPPALRSRLPDSWLAPLDAVLPRPVFLWGFDSI